MSLHSPPWVYFACDSPCFLVLLTVSFLFIGMFTAIFSCYSFSKACLTHYPMGCSTSGSSVLNYLSVFSDLGSLSPWCYLTNSSSAALGPLFTMSTSEVTDSAKPVGAHSTESPDSPFGSKILVTKCPGHSAEQILFSVRVREIDLFPTRKRREWIRRKKNLLPLDKFLLSGSKGGPARALAHPDNGTFGTS